MDYSGFADWRSVLFGTAGGHGYIAAALAAMASSAF